MDKMAVFNDLSLRMREFILSTYHNLPNTLFITSLLLGAIQGNLSMVWLAIGMIINALAVLSAQQILDFALDWTQIRQPSSRTCSIIQDTIDSEPTTIVAPSYWFASTTYFVVFILYNAIQVASKPSNQGVDQKKIDMRVAFSMSVIILSIFFFSLLLLRGFTGCETWLGSSLGILIGSGIAIGYWHILDICHSGIPPDILNVVTALAPPKAGEDTTPVICIA
jgi:hypothetical protein